eukprot:CAMPEP_0172300942 /NCGR_PEP_ID=MMETSP1058-20130122/2936_1 /TAXON_ID=83371 /ORGANISM="Detonula confervacea, Strain CCMP 353" /LENGTH=145 /DNA_ID=CAMNT_0013010901 /DNA_START=45 /DNA_END=485 /DNA_ORIENTATION=-
MKPTEDPSRNPTKKPTTNPTANPITLAPTSCEGRKWYILISGDIPKQCTNGYDVPPGVDDMTYFDTMSECCVGMFDDDKCVYNDVCAPTSSPSDSPTTTPTFGTTPTVSKETTGPPTILPNRTRPGEGEGEGNDEGEDDGDGDSQ